MEYLIYSFFIPQSYILVFRYSVEYLKYYTFTGVLNPNNQYNIDWIKYNCLSKKLFLCSSYPKTQPHAPVLQERPIETDATACLLDRCKLHLSVKQPLLMKFLEW